jgi:hypothetical protein
VWEAYRCSSPASKVQSTPPENSTATRGALLKSVTTFYGLMIVFIHPLWKTGMLSTRLRIEEVRLSMNKSTACDDG